MHCADCEDKACYQGKDCPGLAEETLKAYEDAETLKLTRTASALEGRHYMALNRVQELIRFAREMGYRRLGLAFCIGLSEEARLLNELLVKRFEVESVCCKVCGVAKERLELEKIDDGRFEAMCNPAGQALVLNRAGTDLNIILGLCLGHDIIFTKHSAAPVTTLVVKDRVLAHNPVGALYSNYWRKRIARELEDDERA
ncbi:MAG TPA: DUF1847 domain-containing protein [candidate division WOR-3 bacterium]|uniref:DUF1847 domain-containing protein n=1 Tax=candidate division WOR-3 bacterium TaxID=2052148 RepID=A0A7V0T813_UNCW3|nr:DUF1847 domain-containing protein [candidate division WOR-3 bacterium]